jgi:hypothetical protein
MLALLAKTQFGEGSPRCVAEGNYELATAKVRRVGGGIRGNTKVLVFLLTTGSGVLYRSANPSMYTFTFNVSGIDRSIAVTGATQNSGGKRP